MSIPVALRSDYDAVRLRQLTRRSKDAPQTRRLLALAVIYEGGSRTQAAEIGGVSLQTVRDWVLRINDRGPDGILDGKAPGQPSILSDAHRQRLSEMIESGPIPAVHGVVRWRLADLMQWLWGEYRIRISKQTLSRELRALSFRKLSARPRHHAKSEAAVAALKRLPRAGDVTATLGQGLRSKNGGMTKPVSYKRHRFPPQIIAHAVWLYFRFPLSLRLVEEMLLERGIVVSYETVRRWTQKFGPDYARRLRRKAPTRHDIWHLDEVVVTIAGQRHWLWRAVDQDGYVLDEIVQRRRDTKAAKRLLKRLLKKQGCPPKRLITGKLGSYAAARRQILPAVEHWSHKGLNNRAENSHLPLRRRERAMQSFRSPGGLQRFAAIFSAARNLFAPPRSRRSAFATHLHRLSAMAEWKCAAGVAA